MSYVNGFMEKIVPFTYSLAGSALVLILMLMTLRIVSRNLGLEITGLQLYAQALGVWMVFIVAGALGWEKRHIEIDYFSRQLPERIRPYHDAAVSLLNLAMCAVLVVGSVLAMEEFWTGTSPSVNIPLPLYYVPAIIGMSVLAVVYLNNIAEQVPRLGA
jgi:TRAP-type C4-dicarboxylate transport system permease small subunit